MAAAEHQRRASRFDHGNRRRRNQCKPAVLSGRTASVSAVHVESNRGRDGALRRPRRLSLMIRRLTAAATPGGRSYRDAVLALLISALMYLCLVSPAHAL